MIFMLSKGYSHGEVERKWTESWEKWGIFRFDPKSKRPVFSIDTPPRYASGYLHMGHAKSYLEFEMIARYMRMAGFNVFFPNGYDDNGLPTEKYVEEKLGIRKSSVDRKKFIEKCRETATKLEESMTSSFKKIGMSFDWSTLYQTISDHAIKTAQLSFVKLYKKDQIYRKKEPMLWCPHHQTALAQAEVEDKERNTRLNYVYFDLEDGGKIEIATTRPEFLPSCVGIFVHPEDKRYRNLVGKNAVVPLFGQKVPIMEDEKVEKDFGSGIVMVCTFGDTTDIEWWREHGLPAKICINKDGTMNELAGKYADMSMAEAKKAVISDLEKEGRLIRQEDLKQNVGCCWRCETPVEFIPTEQWFIKTLEHREKMVELGRKIKWHPDYYGRRYEDWVNNLKWDWCISRQRYYGVPFPVWYCRKCGKIVVAEEKDLPVDPRLQSYKCECGSTDLRPEDDVMDTWMTSSLTPQITTRWAEDEKFFKKMFPMSLRPQAHDIIRTWAFYTILKAYLHENSIPWKDVMVSGYVYVEKGVGMSSSKGTGESPDKVIERDGADVLRYWATSAGVGEDLIYREKDITRGQKMLIKLWNASRFVESHLKDYEPKECKLDVEDRWILSELSGVIEEAEKGYSEYNPNIPRREVENFFKNVFCDFYLEMVKHRLYGNVNKEGAQFALYRCLLAVLKIYAPVIPFMTEEIYQELFQKSEGDVSIHVSKWPEAGKADAEALEVGRLARDTISLVRQYKTQKDMAMNTELEKIVVECNEQVRKKLEKAEPVIKGTMKIKEVAYGKAEEGMELGPLKIFVEA